MEHLYLLGSAESFYSEKGFKYIDVPWLIPTSSIEEMMPKGIEPHNLTDGRSLVGSGEQSFIQLIKEGKLKKGCYQTTTPCFRRDVEDELHKEHFLKLELIIVEGTLKDVPKVADLAFSFLKKTFMFSSFSKLTKEYTEEGMDILLNGVEIGSYGHRRVGNIPYVYGTGCALPRLTIAHKYGISH